MRKGRVDLALKKLDECLGEQLARMSDDGTIHDGLIPDSVQTCSRVADSTQTIDLCFEVL